MSINLLPEELTSIRQQQTKRSMVFVVFLLYCCFFLTTNGFLYFKVQALARQSEKLVSLQSEVNLAQEKLCRLEEEIAGADEEYAALASLFDSNPNYTETIRALQYHLNPQLSLQRLTLAKEGWLILWGEAKTMASVGEFAASLGSDAYFLEVNVTELRMDPEDGTLFFAIELLTQGRTGDNEI